MSFHEKSNSFRTPVLFIDYNFTLFQEINFMLYYIINRRQFDFKSLWGLNGTKAVILPRNPVRRKDGLFRAKAESTVEGCVN